MRRTYDISDDTLKRLESSKQAAGDSSLTMTVNRLLASALDVEDEQNKAEELKEWLDARLTMFEHGLHESNAALLNQSTEKLSTAAKKINATTRQATLATQVSIATMLISAVGVENLYHCVQSGGHLMMSYNQPDLNELVKIAMAAAQPMTYDKQAFDNLWASMRDIEERAGEGNTLANLFFKGDVDEANDAIRDGGN